MGTTRVQLPDGNIGEFPAGMSQDQIQGVLAKQFPPPTQGPIDRLQHSFDTNTAPNPNDSLLQTGIKSAVRYGGTPFIHPWETAKGLVSGMDMSNVPTSLQEAQEHPESKPPLAHAIAEGLGGFVGGMGAGEAIGGIGGGLTKIGGKVIAPLAKSIGESAKENPDVAALKGLQVGPKSKGTLKTLSNVEGARPFLKGAQSLEDLQARVPAAKSEIWAPYKQAVNAISDRPIKGPDGITTVGDLEAERLQLSAINRGLRNKIPDPESVKLAEQKGLNQAELLAKEKAVKAALLPELAKTGIKPDAILKAFGQVSSIGENISGKSTLGETAIPSGLGKIAKLSLEKPLQAPENIWGGVKDIAAGRPLFRMKPTDVGIREGFRAGGPKPDFGTFQQPMVKGLLPRPSLEDLPLHDPFVDATNTPSYDFTKSPFPVPTVEGAKNFNLQGVLKRSR